MVDAAGIKTALDLDKVVKAGDFFRNNNRKSTELRLLADLVNNSLTLHVFLASTLAFSADIYKEAFDNMVKGLTMPKVSSVLPDDTTSRNLSDMLEGVKKNMDNIFPPGDALRSDAENHMKILEDFWVAINDSAVINQVQAFIAAPTPGRPPGPSGGITP